MSSMRPRRRLSLYPELTRPLVDAWAMTSLRRHEGRPEVAPWLRGWEDDEEPHTDVVWRRYLPSVHMDGDTTVPPAMVADFFRVAPIHATERLEAVSSRVFDWLLKRTIRVANRDPNHDTAVKDDEPVAVVLDRAGEHVADAKLSELRIPCRSSAKSLGRGEKRQRDRLKQDWSRRLLPGALLIVDARIGGLRDGMLAEQSESVVVTADEDEEWTAKTGGCVP